MVRKVSGHWLLKEKTSGATEQIQSMPPIVGTLRDSGIGEENGNGNNSRLSRNGTGRSSFGIVLKDKFQKNTIRYLPEGEGGGRRRSDDEEEVSIASDDTLIHNMSEGSFDKAVANVASNSLGHSSASPHNSMEGSPRMVSKKKDDAPAASTSGVSLNKKTIRNYTPKESGNMLRQIEDKR